MPVRPAIAHETEAFGTPGGIFDLKGRVALVTGGGHGLGKAIARGLALAGADVVIAGRSQPDLIAGLDHILGGTQASGTYVTADLSRRGEADRLAREVLDQVGRVDVLVSNAGTNVQQLLEEVTDEAWDDVMAVYAHAAMALSRALVPQMKDRAWGRLIYVSSVLGLKGLQRRVAYSAAKAALMGMARSLAVELGAYGITANCVAPGPFATDAIASLRPEEAQAVRGWTALGRTGEPRELVGPVLLLASDAGSYITGSTLVVDGGWLVN
jgi:NAD(P)-dependent dehydrogenase (short-subunit alcohol dehydrogenase family)